MIALLAIAIAVGPLLIIWIILEFINAPVIEDNETQNETHYIHHREGN